MRYVSLFSGIEAATVAWEPLGWEPVAFAEIEPFPCAVLAYRWPDVPNLGDVCQVDWKEFVKTNGAIDVVVGGSPCQSFSIAGGRESLDGESRLMFEYIRAIQDIRPRWLLWENVPGALSVRDNAFGQLVGELADIGYGLAWRVLDAQFFGVAQRRRRLFLVGYLGNGGAAAAVLFNAESVCRNTQSSRKKRESITRVVRADTEAYCSTVSAAGRHGVCCMQTGSDYAPTLKSHQGGSDVDARGAAVICMESGQANATVLDNSLATTLNAEHEQPIICTNDDVLPIRDDVTLKVGNVGDAAFTLRVGCNGGSDMVADCSRYIMRRLTPIECERLQGFPDGHTDIPYKGKPHPANGPRYKALGNSMAVPVIAWIGKRIELCDELIVESEGSNG